MTFTTSSACRPYFRTGITVLCPRNIPRAVNRQSTILRCCASSSEQNNIFAISPLQKERNLRAARRQSSLLPETRAPEPSATAETVEVRMLAADKKAATSAKKLNSAELSSPAGEQKEASSDELKPVQSKATKRQRQLSGANAVEKSKQTSLVQVDTTVAESSAKEAEIESTDGGAKRRRSAVPHVWPRYKNHGELVENALAMRGDPLEKDRGRVVLYRGSATANLVVIGEGPGAEEDQQGLPFVGESGQLLDRIFRYAGFDVESHLYVTNAVKRRPRNNRDPTVAELAFYHGLLQEELRLVAPKIVVLAGRFALRSLLPDAPGITRIRGKWFQLGGFIAMPIFHPSYILRYPSKKALMRDDVLEIRRKFLELVPDATLADVTNQGSAGR